MERATNLDALLQEVVANGGTDLHLSVGSVPRYRRYGKITPMNYAVLDDRAMEELVFNKGLMDLQLCTNLNTVGQVDLSYSIRTMVENENGKNDTKVEETRFRVNVFRQKGSIAAVFRTLPATIPEYTTLGLPFSVFNLYKKRKGLILIVGPTGSGKTTTLASFLNVINKNTYKHIITLEDPIEYVHWHARSLINQREIGTDCDSFANGLRAALREDPDVILVGEMRDSETTSIAVTSAETGHLVCSTLHTSGASETINRIIDMYPVSQHGQVLSQLASILEAVISQQLMPRKDGNGYVVTYEIMYKNRTVRDMIRDKKIDEISAYLNTEEAHKEGMCSMDSTIKKLYKEGSISRDTALDFAFDRRQMSREI